MRFPPHAPFAFERNTATVRFRTSVLYSLIALHRSLSNECSALQTAPFAFERDTFHRSLFERQYCTVQKCIELLTNGLCRQRPRSRLIHRALRIASRLPTAAWTGDFTARRLKTTLTFTRTTKHRPLRKKRKANAKPRQPFELPLHALLLLPMLLCHCSC